MARLFGNTNYPLAHDPSIFYWRRSFLYRFTNVFASVTTCNGFIERSTPLLGLVYLPFYLLLFTQHFQFGLYLSQQFAVRLSTLHGGGLDYGMWEQVRWQSKDRQRTY
jgi:hypothetical protein